MSSISISISISKKSRPVKKTLTSSDDGVLEICFNYHHNHPNQQSVNKYYIMEHSANQSSQHTKEMLNNPFIAAIIIIIIIEELIIIIIIIIEELIIIIICIKELIIGWRLELILGRREPR